jgi:hypothetical protein
LVPASPGWDIEPSRATNADRCFIGDEDLEATKRLAFPLVSHPPLKRSVIYDPHTGCTRPGTSTCETCLHLAERRDYRVACRPLAQWVRAGKVGGGAGGVWGDIPARAGRVRMNGPHIPIRSLHASHRPASQDGEGIVGRSIFLTVRNDSPR